MKKLSIAASALLLSTALMGAPAQAETVAGDFAITGNVGLVSQYSFRGIQQSDENIALQGGFDVGHMSGLYAGLWASSIDFNTTTSEQVEIDLYAGYANGYGPWGYDVGLIYYAYPGADSARDYDFWELAVSGSYDFQAATVSAGINYSPDYFNESGDAQYYYAGVDVPLPYDLSLSAHIGHQEIDDAATFGLGGGEDSYNDWSVGLNYNWQGFDLGVAYVDTNLDEPTECADGCDSRVIFSISRTF